MNTQKSLSILVVTALMIAMASRIRSVSAFTSYSSIISRYHPSGTTSTCASNRQQYAFSLSTGWSLKKRSIVSTSTKRWMSSETDIIDKSVLEQQIKEKGDEIRQLKADGADKATIAPFVEQLQALKLKLDPSIGDVKVTKNASTGAKQQKQQSSSSNDKNAKQKQQQQQDNDTDVESDFITPRETDYSKWYNDLIRVSGLAETSPVRGCMVIKPWGMSIWDRIRTELDTRITQDHGAENAYFPLLIPKSFLSKEAEHVDGFAKECAVVTHHRLKTTTSTSVDVNGNEITNTELVVDPDAELEDPLIIRPTSETMIWYMFRKWIVSYRDLPIKVNQWANVMRWEMRTRPFLRTSEFLWQEGHTAHATADSAQKDATDVLELYATLCEKHLAIPVIRGIKSPSERFAGAAETYTIEALMQNGWALQSGTSHFLGQSFGTAFDVTYQDDTGTQQTVWGTSWGVSTRLVGALIMTHSDNGGLVLPPNVAPIQVVIVPIAPKKNDIETIEQMSTIVSTMVSDLKNAGIRVKLDDRDYIRSGAKFFEWERKGVPIRIEIGPRDIQSNVCIIKYRTGSKSESKITIPLSDTVSVISNGLQDYQDELYTRAKQRLDNGIVISTGNDDINNNIVTYEHMKNMLMNDEASSYPGVGLFLVPWKCNASNEQTIKEECKATIRCYPIEYQSLLKPGTKCFYSTDDDATHMALFGRAF